MKTKKLLQTTSLICFMMLFSVFYSNAQIQLLGLAADHEGVACWDADGSGPEPENTGHPIPWGWNNARYYASSRDYVDSNSEAALCHFLEDINGFPLFLQALEDNGFTPEQVKIKFDLMDLKEDIEGESWFTIGDYHYFNQSDGHYTIELNGESMIVGYLNNCFIYVYTDVNSWHLTSNFSVPFNGSENSSQEVKDVAAAFIADMDEQELRLILDDIESVDTFGGNGRINATYFNINSGWLEKGLPELPFSGLAADHQGLACWDTDGTGPEPEAYGHIFSWAGTDYRMPYYVASRDYDGIDPDKNASGAYFIDNLTGFPNLETQLEYRGYTLDQLKLKFGPGTLGNDVEGVDWGYDGSIHWYTYYGYDVSIEIAGEPILEFVTDTSHGFVDLTTLDIWTNISSYSKVTDVSNTASNNAQYIAMSFLKDLGGHSIGFYIEDFFADDMEPGNGRIDGVFMELQNSKFIARQPAGTHIWENEVSGTWTSDNSPYIVMRKTNVPDGETLTIEPGVVVKFNTTKAMGIMGSVVANGTKENPILFTAYDESVPWGGIGIYDNDISNVPISLTHCIFEYAYAYNPDNLEGYNCGGAIRVDGYEQIEISHCTFRYNGADNPISNNPCGGAMMISECSFPISHCIFHNNYSSWGGALALLYSSNPVIDNCLFYNNETNYMGSTYLGGEGGAVLIWTESDPHFVNCTFADNYATEAGGAVEIQINSTGTFTNCIFWGNEAGNNNHQISVWDLNESSLNVYYSDVEGGLAGITPEFQGEYLFNSYDDPLFTTYEGNVYVPDVELSPCINQGTTDVTYLPDEYIFPEYCLGGNERIFDEAIDIGCFESPIPQVDIDEKINNSSKSLTVLPNPINSNPTVEFYIENKKPITISISDIHGKLISEIHISDLQTGKNRVSWNTNDLSPGIYFVQLNTGHKSITRKIVKLF